MAPAAGGRLARGTVDREGVLDTAERLADAEGFDGLTLRGVARAVGVRPPSLYHHVPGGLDEIREGLRGRATRHLADRLEAALAAPSAAAAAPPTGAEAVRRVLQAMRAFARAHPGLYEAARPGASPLPAPAAAAPDPGADHAAGRPGPAGSTPPAAIDPTRAQAAWRVSTLLRAVSTSLGHEGAAATHHARVLRAALDGAIEAERRGAWAARPTPRATWETLVAMLSAPAPAAQETERT